MRPFFHPRLINGPFDDPGVFIPFLFDNRAILFDLGDIHSLSNRDILKISHAFVSHTHIDHFVGFDRLLRLFLGREKILHLFGPQGFLKNVEGKLSGYTWNLVKSYPYPFILKATEVHPDHLVTQTYPCQNYFLPVEAPEISHFESIIHRDSGFDIYTEILDHRIPCLGFALHEHFHINIIKENLLNLGLEIGPWLKRFKRALYEPHDPEALIEVDGIEKPFVLRALAEKIATITEGQKISYIADVVYHPENEKKIIDLVANSNHLFIEATFTEADRDTAEKKFHLTAWQAGTIAGKARVKQFMLFHFSPRYWGKEHLLREEAERAYRHVISQDEKDRD